jgi:hypothetical protein
MKGRQNNDTKEVIRIHKSKKGRQNNDTKEVIRIRKSKKGRQNNLVEQELLTLLENFSSPRFLVRFM